MFFRADSTANAPKNILYSHHAKYKERFSIIVYLSPLFSAGLHLCML